MIYIEEIKNLRLSIDRVAQLVKVLPEEKIAGGAFYLRSNEVDSCYKSLLLAKAWCGKILGRLGEQTPYKNDGNRHEVKDIEPTDTKADVREIGGTLYESKNHIEKVDYLRQEIQDLIDLLNEHHWLEQKNAYTHLCEARFWLGFELERTKNNSK